MKTNSDFLFLWNHCQDWKELKRAQKDLRENLESMHDIDTRNDPRLHLGFQFWTLSCACSVRFSLQYQPCSTVFLFLADQIFHRFYVYQKHFSLHYLATFAFRSTWRVPPYGSNMKLEQWISPHILATVFTNFRPLFRKKTFFCSPKLTILRR